MNQKLLKSQTMFRYCIIATLLLSSVFCQGQTSPDSISYQAVVRDNFGNELADQVVSIEFAIREDGPLGLIVFEEHHDGVQTNQFGLFAAMIGNGIPTGVGQFTQLHLIPWESHIYFLEVRATIPGQGSTNIIGVSQMLTVPYAFYASRAGSVVNEADGDPQNELIEDFSLAGSVLTISENSTDYSVDLSSLSASESITSITLNDQFEMEITEGGVPHTVNLEPLVFSTWVESSTAVYNITDNVGVGTANPKSTFEIEGSMGMSVTMLNGENYDLTSNASNEATVIFLCDVTTQDVTIGLVSATTCPGRIYKFRKMYNGLVTSNDVNIVAVNGETIDGMAIYQMTNIYSEYASIVSNGNNWYVIEHSND